MCCLKTRHGGFERGAGGRLDDWRGTGYRYVRKLGIESRGCRRGRKEGHFVLDVVGCVSGSSTTICLAACGSVRVVRKRAQMSGSGLWDEIEVGVPALVLTVPALMERWI